MTVEQPLQGKRILIVEDDYYLATDEKALLEGAGASVVGPVSRRFKESDLADAGPLDGAVVDINLGKGPTFELARVLSERGVPFVFVTGYDEAVIPENFSAVPRLEKPIRGRELVAAFTQLIGG